MSTVVIPEGLEPLAVWDTHDHEGPWRRPGDDEDREERWALMLRG